MKITKIEACASTHAQPDTEEKRNESQTFFRAKTNKFLSYSLFFSFPLKNLIKKGQYFSANKYERNKKTV